MASLCSKYLGRKLIKLNKNEHGKQHDQEDEVYGFFPSPFRWKSKKRTHTPANAVTSSARTHARRELFPQRPTVSQHEKQPPKIELNGEETNFDLDEVTLSSVIDSRCQSSLATSQSISSKTADQPHHMHLFDQIAPVQNCAASVQHSSSDSSDFSPVNRYPKSTHDVRDLLLKSTRTAPANVVMFVVQRHFLLNQHGAALDCKVHMGMLVNALYSTSSEQTCIRHPTGQVGFVPNVVLKPLGIQSNSQPRAKPQMQHNDVVSPSTKPVTTSTLPLGNKQASERVENAPRKLSSTASSAGDAAFDEMSRDFDDRETTRNTHPDDSLADDDNHVTHYRRRRQSLLEYIGHLSYSCTHENYVNFSDLADTTIADDDVISESGQSSTVAHQTPSFECDPLIDECASYFTSDASEALSTSSTLPFSTQSFQPIHESELTSNKRESAVNDNTPVANQNNDDKPASPTQPETDKQQEAFNQISLSDITFRPAFGKKSIEEINNTYMNLPDLAVLLKRCHIKTDWNNSLYSNDSGISQTSSTSSVTESETETVDKTMGISQGAAVYDDAVRRDSVGSSSNATTLAGSEAAGAMTPVFRHTRTLCHSPDCVMCCPCVDCRALDDHLSTSSSSATRYIDYLSSIHTGSSTATNYAASELTYVTSRRSAISSMHSYSTNMHKIPTSLQTHEQQHPAYTDDLHHETQCYHTTNTPHATVVTKPTSPYRKIDLLKTIDNADSGNWSDIATMENETETEPSKRLPRLTALFDYAKQSVYDIELCKQEVVTLLEEQNGDWLWVRKENGGVGYIPSSYVVNLEALNLDPHTKTTYL